MISYATMATAPIRETIKCYKQRLVWIGELVRLKEERGLTADEEKRLLKWECEAADLQDAIEAFRNAPVNRVGYTIR